MSIELELSDQPGKSWDAEISAYPTPQIYQSTIFARYKEKSGEKPAFLRIYERGEALGQCLIFLTSSETATWLFGPMLKPMVENRQEEILEEIFNFLKTKGVLAVENASTQKSLHRGTILNEGSPVYSRIGAAPYIDLQPDIHQIIHSFDRSVRKNLNRCEREGVEVVISEDNSLIEPYLEILKSYRARRGFGMPPFYPNQETLSWFNTSCSSMSIALARAGNVFLAGIGFVSFGNVMTELAMATSEAFEEYKLPVNDLLKVKAIEFYKRKGITVYDLAGGEKNSTDPKKQNILRFKEKFASGTAPYGLIDRRILSPRWFVKAIERKLHYFFTGEKPRTFPGVRTSDFIKFERE